MTLTPQEFFNYQKTSFDQFLAFQSRLFDGMEKLVDIHVRAGRETLDEFGAASQRAAELKDVQDAVAFGTSLMQPAGERARTYARSVAEAVSGLQTDLSGLVAEQAAQGQQQFAQTLDSLARNAPAGSETAVAFMKATLAQAATAMESLTKAAANAVEATPEAPEAKTGTRTRRAPAA